MLAQEYEASGQSQRQFCAEHGIGQSNLRYWRWRLEQKAGTGDAPGARRVRLIALKVLDEAPAVASWWSRREGCA